jgi:protein-S-isoprenylcysteine O-methyltransferase Ste14
MTVIQEIGFAILIIFYGGYFLKMFCQRLNGINTDRIAKGKKEKRTFLFEIGLKVSTYTVAYFQIVSIKSRKVLFMDTNTEYIGLLIGFIGVIVFIIAIITMGDSWRAGIDTSQKTIIVKTGIYKYSRNPAFLGFDLLYIGVAIAFPNIFLICTSSMTVIMLHFQILQEEKYLPDIFGDEYKSYRSYTPRYILFF